MTRTHPSTTTRTRPGTTGYTFEGNRADADTTGLADAWAEPSCLVLTPVAAPSILGLYGFFAAPLLIGSNLAGWWGSTATPTGWLFVFSAGFAWYLSSALVLQGTFGRTVLPTGEWRTAVNVPGRTPVRPQEYAEGTARQPRRAVPCP